MQGKGERTGASPRGHMQGRRSWTGRIIEALGPLVAVAAVSTTVASGASTVVAVPVVVLAVLTVLLALRSAGVRPSTHERSVDGYPRLHEELERARRLEYPLTLVRVGHSGVEADPVAVARAEQHLRSTIRATDVLIKHDDEHYLVLPSTRGPELDVVWQRLSGVDLDEVAFWEPRSVAVFPDDAVTGEGLLDECRRHANRTALRGGGGPEVNGFHRIRNGSTVTAEASDSTEAVS